ncbi:MAG TPA: carbohydrate-binding family 9-like protein [Mariniphaga sp.]|nr:carbohydrate-binding family 9-like protein [Mariniphaga sp.]
MNQLYIKEIAVKKQVSLSEAEHILENQTVTNSIDVVNWKEFDYKPRVNFRIGHTGDEIWLKYYVQENHIRALETRTNGDVYKDSCVEFFVAVDDKSYYNFEFSCIGTIHLAWGGGRNNRKHIEPKIIEAIEIKSTLGDQPFDNKSGDFNWEMMIRIPKSSFAYSKIKTFKDLKANANFYKCGDETAKPHYITWNPIKTENPDYHRPEYFGKVQFG